MKLFKKHRECPKDDFGIISEELFKKHKISLRNDIVRFPVELIMKNR